MLVTNNSCKDEFLAKLVRGGPIPWEACLSGRKCTRSVCLAGSALGLSVWQEVH